MSVSFSANLSALRRDRGVSQKQAAQELGISQALLSHYEKGIRECSLDFVARIAAYYGVTADYLLGITDVRQQTGGLFDPQPVPGDDQPTAGTVLRELAHLFRAAEGDAEAERFFADYFTLCARKYLAVTRGQGSALAGMCDAGLNRLCEAAPAAAPEDHPPVFSQTVRDHAMLLLNRAIAEAFQTL